MAYMQNRVLHQPQQVNVSSAHGSSGAGGPPIHDCFLRLNHDFPNSPNYPHDTAVKTLLRLPQVSQTVAYSFVHIDKPQDGETHAIYLLPTLQRLPLDGVRYLEEEQRYNLNVGRGLELEVMESRGGFVPGDDHYAWRIRRLYRLTKGGHPSMALLHYSKGNPQAIPPQIANQPVRHYPLRKIDEPSIYVYGERMGQKEFLQQRAMAGVVSQNAHMAQAENRRERERREGGYQHPPLPADDEDDPTVTTRSLALLRFTRNHDHLAEIFSPVTISQIPDIPLPYADVSASELENKLALLESQIEKLRKGKIACTRDSVSNAGVPPDVMTVDG
ncbi:uncharacterized protein EI90DRAFT_3037192 [Cantharellus anzutake]|uniref:uncharacterized protein n=1 Tax=Cantharellus anzutake TaxID=1750568 RepID=UPI001903F8FE|nr:uncharacterized protein EI90DRAFT_3037192 [Cantharellus anzutake]KAF8339596.1 hypothetical protein EI90DRAFT_3037192 [Cantharellus anzutake]